MLSARVLFLVINLAGVLDPVEALGRGNARACTLETVEARTVSRIVDSETLVLDDGSEVRLIGALAPTLSADAREQNWPHVQKARRDLELLVLGRSIELRTTSRQRDRYGRRIAHAFVLDGGERVWVQGRMIRAGHARAYALPGHEDCLAQLLVLERAAREARLGLWSVAAFAVRDAHSTAQILRLAGSFALVEGVVERVAAVGPRIYLNFGRDWRRDFTIAVPKRILKGQSLAGFEGRRLRVRGWVQRRNGPMIEISTLDELEFVDKDLPTQKD